jgi:hypothetical protein
MFSMNKETMMMVAVAVALLAAVYLYRENQKSKVEFESFKKLLQPVPVVAPPAPVVPHVPKKEVVAAAPEPAE